MWRISFLRLLQLEPFLLRSAGFQRGLEGQKPIADGGVVINLDPVLGDVDQPKATRFSSPAFQVFAFEKGLKQFSGPGVLGAEAFLGGAVDHKGPIQPCHNAPAGRAVNILKGLPARSDLVPQGAQGGVFQLP